MVEVINQSARSIWSSVERRLVSGTFWGVLIIVGGRCTITMKMNTITMQVHVITMQVHTITMKVHVITIKLHIITTKMHVIHWMHQWTKKKEWSKTYDIFFTCKPTKRSNLPDIRRGKVPTIRTKLNQIMFNSLVWSDSFSQIMRVIYFTAVRHGGTFYFFSLSLIKTKNTRHLRFVYTFRRCHRHHAREFFGYIYSCVDTSVMTDSLEDWMGVEPILPVNHWLNVKLWRGRARWRWRRRNV